MVKLLITVGLLCWTEWKALTYHLKQDEDEDMVREYITAAETCYKREKVSCLVRLYT